MAPTLPPTFAEAQASLIKTEALAYAREFVRMIRDQQITFWGQPLHWFARADNRQFARERMKGAASTPQGMMDLCNLARTGWGLADEAARELIIDYQHRGEDMPPTLVAYNMEIVDPRRVWRQLSAPKKEDRFLRDLAITGIVGDVCRKFSLKPMRQRTSKRDRPSGRAIVAEALQAEHMALGESAVVDVWRRYGRIAFPNPQQ
ncbi:hypothetical protein [Bradyrhizobium canariense]|uniref:hypothetical protein n=1 Tax=Bradyrhizobium canariense TaxID=255045 RepID=UPI001178B5DD|nr:hypothetical protein [Bradyrhizobium canariense]